MATRPTENDPGDRTEGMGKALKRRGLIAGAAALVAGLMTKQTSVPVAANGSTWQMPYDSGPQNSTNPVAFFVNNNTGTAVIGSGHGFGVVGNTDGIANSGFAGVSGVGNGTGTYGVYGNGYSTGTGVYGTALGTGIGVFGNSSSSTGVYGNSGSSYGVYGTSDGSTGIYGNTNAIPLASSTPGASGVLGVGNGANTAGVSGNGSGAGIGVFGFSNTNVGVFGISGGGGGQPYGVVGTVSSAPGFGLFGVTNIAGTVGFAGGAGVAGAIAGQFAGPVNIYNNGAIAPGNLFIEGNYTAMGTKTAAVPHPDGSHRLLYCVESPEAWFEDFGEGTLAGGKAEVKLDADFAAVVDMSKLHVFCMPHDEHHLHVAQRTASGFAVTAAPSTTAAAAGKKASELSGTFSYRVVAKRKDVAAPRLAKFVVPKEVKAATPLVIPTLSKGETKPAPDPAPKKPAPDPAPPKKP